MTAIFSITYFLLLATIGGLALEQLFLCLNGSVWAEEPSDVPSDERMMAAWGLLLVQAALIGLGGMNALQWLEGSTLFVASPMSASVGEMTVVVVAAAVTVPPVGLVLERVLRLPLRRSLVLVLFQVSVFALMTTATLCGLLLVAISL